MELVFRPCDACVKRQSDTPLCAGCQHNDLVIKQLLQSLRSAEELAAPVWPTTPEEEAFWDRVEDTTS